MCFVVRMIMALPLAASMSMTLILVFGLVFGLVAAVGSYFNIGVFAMVGIGIFIGLIQWLAGPAIIRMMTNMRQLKPGEYPWIEEIVRDLSNKNNVKMPKIAIANSGMPNAFVFGRTNKSATLTLTQGLLNTLSKEEVKAVISHEIGHIKHNDMVVMTIISVLPVLAYYIAISTLWGRRTERNQGGGAILIGIGAFAVYFITNLMILYFSRLREFYADRFAGYNIKPSILANALAKITYGLSLQKQNSENSLIRSFYAVDPVAASVEVSQFPSYYEDKHISESEVKQAMEWEKKNSFMKFGELFRTHPLTYKRIEKLYKLENTLNKQSSS